MNAARSASPTFKACLVLQDPPLKQRVLELAAQDRSRSLCVLDSLQELVSFGPCSSLLIDTASVSQDPGAFLRWLAFPSGRGPVVLVGEPGDGPLAAACIDAGVDAFARLPLGELEWVLILAKLGLRLGAVSSPEGADTVVLESPQMQAIYGRVQSLAPLEALNVLIAGETGTGKQELARLFHHYSKRYQGPFAEVDCASLPGNLVESELFGHEAGAYTDARQRQTGLLEAAQKGTLFLDEVGELPLEAQAKLLRALELRRFRRVGGRDEISLDVRLVSASNRDLAEEVRQGRFRADLYYRLNGVLLSLPPLRERPDDILTLAAVFYAKACSLFGRPAFPLDPAVIQALQRHAWPGNIRELKSVMQRLVALAPPGIPLSPSLVGDELQIELSRDPGSVPGRAPRVPNLREMEEVLARQALAATGGNKTAAARLMGVSKPTYFRMLKVFGIKN